MAKYQYYFFDLDGTLINSERGITNAVKYVLGKYHIKEYDMETLRKFIGPPLGESFQRYFGFPAEETERLAGCYREYYSVKGLYEAEVYDDIEPLLEKLWKAGKTLVVATSKPEHFAVDILERFRLAEYFTCVAGATMDASRIHKDEVIAYALSKCSVKEKSRAVMIGDREHDIYGAGRNDLDSIGVLFGFGSRVELEAAGADYIVGTPEEIMDI